VPAELESKLSLHPRKAVVVSHTHWDREWYLPLHRFRVDFARMLGQVLGRLEAGGEFQHFLLDGQTLVLEDHLLTHPEDLSRIIALTEAGKLSLGPWYILPDEFLVSGEATVRNLQIGHKVAEACGGVQKVGYMPDSFGHLAQMPQILRGVGIDSFVYTRGNGEELDDLGWTYTWAAPDGSEVLAYNQCEGYCNAGGLGYEELWHAHTQRKVNPERAVAHVGELFEKMAARPCDETVLISNGCDHFPPQSDFGPVMAALREAYPDTEFIHAGYPELFASLRNETRNRKSYQGELLSGKLHLILPGVWSSRMPLKQRNDRCQTLLSNVVESLDAALALQANRPPSSELIGYSWKKLLENHPHDSICGCSIDEVHREMDTRFDQVEQSARAILNEKLEGLLPLFGHEPSADRDTAILVANSLPEKRSAMIERLVILQPFGYDLDSLQLFDEDGAAIPFQILNRWTVERFWGVDYRAELFAEDQLKKFAVYRERFGDRILKGDSLADEHDTFLHILIYAEDLPPVGTKVYFLREGEKGITLFEEPVRGSDNRIENEFLSVEIHPNGLIDLFDKVNYRRYDGLALLENVADIGDEYDFGTLPGDKPIRSLEGLGEITSELQGPLRGRLSWKGSLSIPCSLSADRKSRSEEYVDCPVSVQLSLDINSPRLDVEIEFENLAEDHRLRVIIPTGIASDSIVSDGQFMLNRRSLALVEHKDWAQPPTDAFPQQDFTWVDDEKGGLAILAQGLPEVSARKNAAGEVDLEVTLLRAVAWLSRDDFADRKCSNAGPTLYTPEAQCRGKHRFQLSMLPFQGDGISAGVKAESTRWRTPLPCRQGVAAMASPSSKGLIWGLSSQVSLSSLRTNSQGDGLLLRLYNLGGEIAEETLHTEFDIREVWKCNLLEEREVKYLDSGLRELIVSIGPHEILTIEISI